MESAVDKHHAGNRAGKQHAVIKTNVPDADEYGPVKADVAMGRSTWRNLSHVDVASNQFSGFRTCRIRFASPRMWLRSQAAARVIGPFERSRLSQTKAG